MRVFELGPAMSSASTLNDRPLGQLTALQLCPTDVCLSLFIVGLLKNSLPLPDMANLSRT